MTRTYSQPGRLFLRDLFLAVNTLRRTPWLPITSVGIALLADLNAVLGPKLGALSVLTLPIALFAVGYVGTERLWYKRAWTGAGMTVADVWWASWAYLGRYLRLGLMAVVPIVLVELPLLLTSPRSYFSSKSFTISLAVLFIAIDVLATFITPALAFTTRSATRAIFIGLTLMKETWPESALYVLCPPLALQLGVMVFPAGPGLTPLILSATTALLNLAFKGANAAYYLRLSMPAEDDAWPVTA